MIRIHERDFQRDNIENMQARTVSWDSWEDYLTAQFNDLSCKTIIIRHVGKHCFEYDFNMHDKLFTHTAYIMEEGTE